MSQTSERCKFSTEIEIERGGREYAVRVNGIVTRDDCGEPHAIILSVEPPRSMPTLTDTEREAARENLIDTFNEHSRNIGGA